jgi:hypothetical protein
VPARSLPTTRIQKSNAKLQEVRVLTPWGKGCTNISDVRYKLLVEVVCLLTYIPPSIPRLMYYNV